MPQRLNLKLCFHFHFLGKALIRNTRVWRTFPGGSMELRKSRSTLPKIIICFYIFMNIACLLLHKISTLTVNIRKQRINKKGISFVHTIFIVQNTLEKWDIEFATDLVVSLHIHLIYLLYHIYLYICNHIL